MAKWVRKDTERERKKNRGKERERKKVIAERTGMRN